MSSLSLTHSYLITNYVREGFYIMKRRVVMNFKGSIITFYLISFLRNIWQSLSEAINNFHFVFHLLNLSIHLSIFENKSYPQQIHTDSALISLIPVFFEVVQRKVFMNQHLRITQSSGVVHQERYSSQLLTEL